MRGRVTIEQTDAVRDHVLPVVALDAARSSGFRFLGTGFVIGTAGGFLTAAHVVRDEYPDGLRVLFVQDNRWLPIPVLGVTEHDDADVAFLELDGGPWTSIFVLSDRWEGASCEYQLWGYPADAARELVIGNRIAERPDLVYSTGHVRRRVAAGTFPPPLASQLFEVSPPAGPGTSGSPLVLRNRPAGAWPVFGIYVGDRRTDDSFTGYAEMAERVAEWEPPGLGRQHPAGIAIGPRVATDTLSQRRIQGSPARPATGSSPHAGTVAPAVGQPLDPLRQAVLRCWPAVASVAEGRRLATPYRLSGPGSTTS